AYTKFLFEARNGKYSNFQWDKSCFTGIDHAVGEKTSAVYILDHAKEGWKAVIGKEKGNFDFLMLNDIETRNPNVVAELKRWGKWYYDAAQFDGVRLDAVKHMDPAFVNEWIGYLRTEINPNLKAIAEFWLSDDLGVLLDYLDATNNRVKLFDAPLHHNIVAASLLREKFDLRTLLNETLLGTRSEQAVTFVDNHDTQPGQSLEEYTAGWFKRLAYAFVLLRKDGLPCIFYPDLFGGMNKEETEFPQMEKVPELPLLLKIRSQYAYGEQHDYHDDPNCIGFTRTGLPGNTEKGCAVLISNSRSEVKTKRMYVGNQFVGHYFINTMNMDERTPIEEDGFGSFSIMPSGIAVYIPNSIIADNLS
ncbi:MAG: alpha-amylase, partial [Pedobacter sp.]